MADDNTLRKLRCKWSGDVEIAEGTYIPERAEVTAEGWRGMDVNLVVELENGRYRCKEFHAFAPDGSEVTGEWLREVPIAWIIRQAIMQSSEIPDVPTVSKETARRAPTEATLRQVAAVYRFAYAVGEGPKQRIAIEFGIATSTAGRWIARAREAGLLPAPDELGP